MPITLKNIAVKCGVNISTVSRSLNGSYGVDAGTRSRVIEVAESMNYRRNRVAANLATGKSHTLGLIISDIRNPFFAEFARGVEDAGTERPLPMRALATILAMPFTRNETGSYAWPTAYEESPTDEAWQALVESGLYPQADIDAMRTGAGAGGYLGYRTAITADGDWQFFVAGD